MSNILNYIKANKWESIFKFALFLWLCSVPFKNALYQVFTFLIIFLCAWHFIVNKNYDILISNLRKTKALTIAFCFIIITMILANLLNLELLGKKSWHHIIMLVVRYGFVFIALAYFYVLGFFSKKEIVGYLLFGTMNLSLMAIVQGILNPEILFGDVRNIDIGIKGTLNHRNAMGLVMSASVVFSFFILRKNLLAGAGLLGIYTFCMIFSFSRSGWVASAVAFLIFIFVNFKKLDKRFFIILTLFIIALVVVYFNVDSFHTRFDHLLNGDSSYRTTLWKYGFGMIEQDPIFGYGVGSWRSLPMSPDIAAHTGVHNSIIEIMLFTGIIGLVAWISAVIVVLMEVIRSKNFIYLPPLVYFVVLTQFDFSVFDSKELLSYVSVFLFLVYSDKFKENSCKL